MELSASRDFSCPVVEFDERLYHHFRLDVAAERKIMDIEPSETRQIVPIVETPHGTSSSSSRLSHRHSCDSGVNADSGYLSLTPRSGGFSGSRLSAKRSHRPRGDLSRREGAPRHGSKLNCLINASEREFDSLVEEESQPEISQDSGNFSYERSTPRALRRLREAGDASWEPRRGRSRRTWISGAAPVTPASGSRPPSPPPSPAVPSASFVACEPLDEDVEMKLVVPQSTPYPENSPCRGVRGAVRVSSRCSTGRGSPSDGGLDRLAIRDESRAVADIKPKRLDFSQRALSYRLRRTRATPDLTGKPTADLMSLLGEKSNHWRIVSKILSHLSPQDLCSFSMVSKAWRRICNDDSRANMRRLGHIIIRQNTKENLKLLRKAKLEGNIATSPKSRYVRKGYLLEVQNFLQEPSVNRLPRSPPVSPSKVKFHSFVKASRTLEPWEHLLACPSCSFPCHVDDKRNVGKCSRQGCSMEFCTSCSSRPHAGPCKTPLLATPTKRNKRLVVGSRQSKRNLRRL